MQDNRPLPDKLEDAVEQQLRRLPEGRLAAYSAAQQQQLKQLFAVSSFIGRAVEQQQQVLEFDNHNAVVVPQPEHYVQILEQATGECTSEDDLKKVLRQQRQRLMAALAAADILGQLPLRTVLEHLSKLADAFIEVTIKWLYPRYCERLGNPLDSNGELQPLLIIAMGKLGGGELNFSSDIDLIFCYPEQGETSSTRKPIANSVFFTRLAQALVACLDVHTADGFVYRVDLRLRPFGQSGPVVTSFAAIEHYYQEHGRDWERYAMVKARLIGAPPENAHELEAMLRPFVYRRYIDFSVIDALRKMKALIRQEGRRRQLQHNIKLGPGGIREIEFIAQAFQLIRGGQERRLQTRSIYTALEVIEDLGLLEPATIVTLLESYELLRKVEHSLQQIDDEQTQQLPQDELNQLRLQVMLGESSWSATQTRIHEAMQRVHDIFKEVIGNEDHDDEPTSPLQMLWQDLADDEASLELIADYTDAPADKVWQQLKSFRQDIRKRGSGPRGRKAIARLLPVMLESILKAPQPLDLLDRVLIVLKRVVSRTAYLELLIENPGSRDQLLKLCRASAWIADQIASYPLLLDELIDPQHLYELPQLIDYPRLLDEYLLRIPEQDLESQMDVLRQARQALQLKVAAADISGALPLMKVSDHLSYLAEAVIADVVQLAWQQLASKHGTPPNQSIEDTGFAVMAYGKLGGLELGYGSDLDLVFISDADYSGQTDGLKPIEVQQFYLRLAQRILHFFTVRTMAGVLYEVDMRLRPSGKSGLLVSRLDSYGRYLAEDAWTWEHQALVRARPVYGCKRVRQRLSELRESQLCQPREELQLREQVVTMRQKMRDHLIAKHASGFDLKQGQGGIADIEFLVQYLVLRHSAENPKLCHYTDNIRILECAGELGLLAENMASSLITSYQHLRELQHQLALDNQPSLTEADVSEHTEVVIQAWSLVFDL